MTTYSGGIAVRSGYYWNASKWSVVPVEKDGDSLPGERAETYLKVPILAVLLLMPAMGGLFVVFLPLIGFLLTFQAALRPVSGFLARSAESLAATVGGAWRPGEAHFTGKHHEGEAKEPKAPEARQGDSLEELERTIAEKRRRS